MYITTEKTGGGTELHIAQNASFLLRYNNGMSIPCSAATSSILRDLTPFGATFESATHGLNSDTIGQCFLFIVGAGREAL